MPWYSMYHGEGGGSRHRNSYQPSRHGSTLTGSTGSASHTIYHPIRLTSTSSTSSPYSTPTYRQHSYYTAHTHTHVPSSGRRQSSSSYSSGSSTHTTTTASGGVGGGGTNSQYGLDGSRHQRHSSPSSGFGAFKSRAEWHHKRMDSATERLLARADALTDRLHRLLAKSADLHWRRTDHYVPRADIFSRMSHATSASTTTTAPPAPAAAPSPSPLVAPTTIPSKPMPSREPVRDDDIRVTVNVDVERRASPPTPPPSPPPTLPKVHVITIKLSNSCSNNHRPKTKPSVVRIIPIHIEKDSSQDIDELDIQHPDYDSPPPPPPPPPASVHHIPIYRECSTVAHDRPNSPVDVSSEIELHTDFESETIDCQPQPSLSVSVEEHSSTHESRRLALTLR